MSRLLDLAYLLAGERILPWTFSRSPTLKITFFSSASCKENNYIYSVRLFKTNCLTSSLQPNLKCEGKQRHISQRELPFSGPSILSLVACASEQNLFHTTYILNQALE